MDIEGLVMSVFYPGDAVGMRITSALPFSLPLVQAFRASFREDFGLSDAGFVLEKTHMDKDTLYAVWKPPSALEDRVESFALAILDGHIVTSTVRNKKTGLTNTTRFEDYQESGPISFPRSVTTVESKGGKVRYRSRVQYQNVEFDTGMSASECQFSFPDSVDVRQEEW